MAVITLGSELKAAVNAPTSPSSGFITQTIAQGKTPLSIKTANKSPQNKNHFLAFLPIVDRTSAFIIALSIEEIVSNKINPQTVSAIANRSIFFIIFYKRVGSLQA